MLQPLPNRTRIGALGVGQREAGVGRVMDVYGKTKTSDALWFVVNGAAAPMQQMPIKVNVAFGSIDVSCHRIHSLPGCGDRCLSDGTGLTVVQHVSRRVLRVYDSQGVAGIGLRVQVDH